MLTGNNTLRKRKYKYENSSKKYNKKGLGVIIIKNKHNLTSGILTDGDLKRLSNENGLENLKIKVMKKNPISVNKNMLAAQALSIMNSKKLQVYVFMIKIEKIKLWVSSIFIIFWMQI